MTEPLVPAEVTLRGLPWMRLDTDRLLNSDLFALSNGDEFKAAVALWCRSWSQLPAGSLPDDDRILASLSGAGAKWKRVKPMAMRGWVLADDGRLYHPVVAEQVLAAWEERQHYLEAKAADASRKREEREERAALFSILRAAGNKPAWNTKTAQLRALAESVPDLSQGQVVDCPPPVRNLSPVKTGRDGTVRALTPDTYTRSDVSEGLAEDLARALREVGFPECSGNFPDLVQAKALGVTEREIRVAGIDAATSGKPLGWAIQRAVGKRHDALTRAAGMPTASSAPVLSLEARAAGTARHERDRLISQANGDFGLQLIDEAKRDERVANAWADYRRQLPATEGAQA